MQVVQGWNDIYDNNSGKTVGLNGAYAWKKVTWRQGVKRKLRSRFAAVRVRPAHRDYWQAQPRPGEAVEKRV